MPLAPPPKPVLLIPKGTGRLVMSREFALPLDLIWAGFTDPALLALWLPGPAHVPVRECQISLQTGGGYLLTWAGRADGTLTRIAGKFLEVRDKERIADEQWLQLPGQTPVGPVRNVVAFHRTRGGTRVYSTTKYPSAAMRDANATPDMGARVERACRTLEVVARGLVRDRVA